MGKGQHGILQALTTIAQQLSFVWRGLNSDNGSEFINGHLVAFCASGHSVHALPALEER